MLWKNRNLRISRRRKVGFRDFSQNLRRLSEQTVVVVIITIILAVVISVMDSGILGCINFLMK